MITLSTHTLDSLNGSHAAGIKVNLTALDLDNSVTELWSKVTDSGGRLTVKFDLLPELRNCQLRLSFFVGDYFVSTSEGVQMKSISLNIELPDPNGVYHLPIIISPFGASLWWSR